jgi:hypothetical protein
MMKTTRRNLLKMASIGSFLPGGLLYPKLLRANATPTILDRYFVFAYFSGGWDSLLSLDPKDPSVYTANAVTETGIQLGYNLLRNVDEEQFLIDSSVEGLTFGTFIGNLASYAHKMTVLRGMTMEAVAHIVARRHVLTGIRPAGTAVRGSSIATILSYLLGEDEPIPNLVAGLESFNIGHPLWASGLPASNIEDLYRALSPSEEALVDSQRDALEAFFAKQEQLIQTPLEEDIYSNRRIARSLIEQELAEYFDIDSATSEMQDLREHFGVNSGDTGEGGYMALMAAQALTKGISRCVTIKVASGLDTHQGAAWQNDQGPNQQEGFDSIAALASHLEATPFGDIPGDNWLNHTTIMCFSEFGRGAKLNSNGGRDHNQINSMLMLGGGIKGGQIIGGTSDVAMQAQPVDLLSGELSTAGELIGNNHIARTLLHSIGVEEDIGDFRADPLIALLEE